MSKFTHLHVHSDYSLLRSTITVQSLVEWARDQHMESIALTDEGNLFAVPVFTKICKQYAIRPIIGCEFVVVPQGRQHKAPTDSRRIQNTIVLLAKSNKGYKNISMLSSLAYKEGFYYHPRIDDELLSLYHEDLILLTGSVRSEIPQLLLSNNHEKAAQRIAFYRELFGKEHVFFELNDHKTVASDTLNEKIILYAKEFGMPCVAANESYYVHKEDAEHHDILLHIGINKQKTLGNRLFQSDEFYLKDEHTMCSAFPREFIDASAHIASQCNVSFEAVPVQLPEYRIPQGFSSTDAYLKKMAASGLTQRYHTITPEIQARLDYELGIITDMKFTGYFLIILDLITYAKDHHIPVGPGRGSGAGSLVAYSLGITNIDPIKYKLLFERFLNPERISMPDFDIDFCIEGRASIIKYATDRYGTEHVGQIITFGTLKARAALKDVGRVLGLPFAKVDEISKLIPPFFDGRITSFISGSKIIQRLMKEMPDSSSWIAAADKLTGMNRHVSTHAAGIVIGRATLDSYVPLYRDPKTGMIATQFSMDYLEEYGLVKMDILGLKTLTVIRNAEAQIRSLHKDFSIDSIPEDDKKTFKLLSKGDTLAVFQLESSGYQKTLKKAKPQRIADIIALNALYRPGPMQFIDQYIQSKNHPAKIRYPLPELKEILEETYGIIVYQEQVMQIVQKIGSFSLGQADIIRKAMGKKKVEEMERLKKLFIEKAKENGYKATQAAELFDLLEPFAGYGFNKAHAAAYAVLAYQTAYLKANFPAQFMAATLNCEFRSPDTLSLYLKQIRLMNIPLLPPNINRSHVNFTVVEGNIYYGLMGIKHMSSSCEVIVSARNHNKPYKNCVDFLERVGKEHLSKKIFEVLILSGAFDTLHPHRRVLYENREKLYQFAQENIRTKSSGQFTLFDNHIDNNLIVSYTESNEKDFTPQEKLSYEKELLGIYFSGHPLDRYKSTWQQMQGLSRKTRLSLIGVYRTTRIYRTAKGEEVIAGILEDYLHTHDIVVFPQQALKYTELLKNEHVLIVEGNYDEMGNRIIVEHIRLPILDEDKEIHTVHLQLPQSFDPAKTGHALKAFMLKHRGSCEVRLHIPTKKGIAKLSPSSQFSITPSKQVLDDMGELEMVERIWVDRVSPLQNSSPP